MYSSSPHTCLNRVSRGKTRPGLRASVGDGAYLEDCIVGHGYDVRPGETIRGGALIRRS